jgi:protein-L-isoaspartate(D-aspartate) O-methyltransferase
MRRRKMVEMHIAARGIRSQNILDAMRAVPREDFVPERLHEFAYDDRPLPIGGGQTISQPYIVAFMIDALKLKGGESVLEIGTGSGYAAAVISKIAANVYSIERMSKLASNAAATLHRLGYENVHVSHADGTLGWPEHAPYDAIIVAAGGPDIPSPLKEQLRLGGRLVIPIGRSPHSQTLTRVTRLSKTSYRTEEIADVRFVPLIGAAGWDTERGRQYGRHIRYPDAISS